MLSLAHRVKEKDQLARTGPWEDAVHFNGIELRDRTVGVIGLGGVGARLVQMLSGFGMSQPIVFDPYGSLDKIEGLGARGVDLPELMKKSDFVCVCCPLNEETRGLIGREQLGLMLPTAYLINAARGGIVEEAALVDALRARQIAGAAFDVFDGEPANCDHPYMQLDNIILAPHCIGWTEELFRDIGRMACRKVTLLARGQVPDGFVNPDVLQRPSFQNKLRRFQNEVSVAAF
jgi:phosphoglycerate dehydrogenase-like enzyme